MAFKYKTIVPWGRNFNEYRRMFDLTDTELKLKILGCGDGPAGFNYECNKRGGHVVSVDPIYKLTKNEIEERIKETYSDVLSQTEQNREKFKWDIIRSIDELGKIRMEAMRVFLDSYEEGRKNGLYIPASLPELPFPDSSFDIALSSHFLFLYTDKLSYEFHEKSIIEMLRAANEARIFPLLDINGKKSPYLKKIMNKFGGTVKKVDYEFQTGGNEVIIIKRTDKPVHA